MLVTQPIRRGKNAVRWITVLIATFGLTVIAPLIGKPVLTAREFKPNDGLAHQVVRDIALGPDGQVWMATWGGGISRFDGSRWETINEGKILADFMIRCLAFDQDGTLWVGTPEGIRQFAGGEWRFFTSENTPALKEDSVFSILPRRNGEIWFGMLDGYLYSYDSRRPESDRWQEVRSQGAFSNGALRSQLELEDGSVWVGGEHLFYFDGSGWTEHRMDQVAFALCQAEDGSLYAAETRGLYRFDAGSWRLVPDASTAPRSLGLAPDGSLLVGTIRGVRRLNEGVWSDFSFGAEETIPYVEVIRSLRDGSTWIGTRSGVYMTRLSNWSIFELPESEASVLGASFYADDKTEPAVFLPDGRIFRLDGDSWKSMGTLGEAGNPVISVLEYSSARLIVRRAQSIVEYDPKTLQKRSAAEVSTPEAWSDVTLSGTRDWDQVSLAGDGTLWWSRNREGRLYRWSGTEWVPSQWTSHADSSIDFFKIQPDGGIWMISDNSASLSGTRIPALDILGSPQLRGHRVTDLWVARDGSAWLSTSGSGIVVWDETQTRHWTSTNGLPSNWVRSLFQASDGVLWAGMDDSAIASFNDGRWISFTPKDFHSEGSVSWISEGPGGVLWFALEPGKLLSYHRSTKAPETAIDLFPSDLLPLGRALFTFRGWDPQQLTSPSELAFSWRITSPKSGEDIVPWTPFSASQTVSSPPLNPGSYLFEVRAADKQRNVDATPASRPFTVETYLYLRPAFWLTVIPVVLLVLFLAFRLYRAQVDLVKLARVDGLTGVFKRDYFSQLFQTEILRSTRYKRDLSILILDIDHFKTINDRHGHAAGDQVLAAVSKAITNECRNSDLVARWGGEEFLILLPETTLKQAGKFAERVRVAVERTKVQTSQGVAVCTVSIGAASLSDRLSTGDALLNAADKVLYQAKSEGRNRIVFA